MAEAKGYTCDGIDCGKFEASTNNQPPAGWIRVSVVAPIPKPATGVWSEADTKDREGDRGHFDLCSNRCAMALFFARSEANGEELPKGLQRSRPGTGKPRGRPKKTTPAFTPPPESPA